MYSIRQRWKFNGLMGGEKKVEKRLGNAPHTVGTKEPKRHLKQRERQMVRRGTGTRTGLTEQLVIAKKKKC